MADIAVINASPLIYLSRSGHLDLLNTFAKEIWVPEPVSLEISQRGPQDVTAKAIDQTGWLIVKPSPVVPPSVLAWSLGAGESAVLAMASANNVEAIIDDLAGRKCAASLNIPVRGTLGIVLTAKQRGVLPAARPVMERMMQTGLYLSKKVLDEALRRVGE